MNTDEREYPNLPVYHKDLNLGESVYRIYALMEGFHFRTPSDRSRALASFITPALVRTGLLQGPMPIEIAVGPPKSGQTYRHRLIPTVYDEDLRVISARSDNHGCEQLLRADDAQPNSFIQLDDVRGRFHSQALEDLIINGPAASGEEGKSEEHTRSAVPPALFIASHGFRPSESLMQKAVVVRTEARPNHQFKTYAEGCLLDHAYANRSDYVGAVVRICEEWAGRGKPQRNPTAHPFTEWCGALSWIIEEIRQTAPLMDGHDEVVQGLLNPYLPFFRALGAAIDRKGARDKVFSQNELVKFCVDESVPIPGASFDFKEATQRHRSQFNKIMVDCFEGSNAFRWDNFVLTRERSQPPHPRWFYKLSGGGCGNPQDNK